MSEEKSLYDRLGGYDAISAVANDLLPRLQSDSQLGRFWEHRGDDGIEREKQLLIDFLCANAGGPMLYTGRDMKISHKGMKISESDWGVFIGHLKDTLSSFDVPDLERGQVLDFIETTKAEIVEC
ncbi:MAG: group 1 truncated hemoglobin [Verrucomicrobiales bacterium]